MGFYFTGFGGLFREKSVHFHELTNLPTSNIEVAGHLSQWVLGWGTDIHINDRRKPYLAGIHYRDRGLKEIPIDGNINCAAIDWRNYWLLLDDGRIVVFDNEAEVSELKQTPHNVLHSKGDNQTPLKLNYLTAGETHVVGCTDDGIAGLISRAKGDNCGDTIVWEPFTLGRTVDQVACGKEHVVMLTQTGQVFTYGKGSRGQLGHNSTDDCTTPTLVDQLDGLNISSVAAGGWHSMALSDIGDLYVWGWNESGQLGLPCRTLQENRAAMQFLSQSANQSISKSTNHESDTSQVSANSKLTDTSEPTNQKSTANEYPGKLCDDENDGSLTEKVEFVTCATEPQLIEFPEDLNIVDVSCGSRHSAIVTDFGDLLTTGWNDYGQLGHGNTLSCDSFSLVSMFKQQHLVVDRVTCGYWSTLASTSSVKC